MDFATQIDTQAGRLLIGLILGAIIGIQRGWVERHEKPGSRVAGIRTFSLIGLMGALCGLISEYSGTLFIGLAFIALAAIACVAYIHRRRRNSDLSITSLIGVLITFLLGVLAMAGDMILAASAAVVTAVILDNKQELHSALARLQEYELDAALRLLLISVVMLPLLPNEAMGPWQAINPYEIWWMVVLIASISFVGYFAMKIGGTEKGILFTCLFAGVSSSTALTLQFSHLSKRQPELSAMLASGILLSCGTMFPRVLLVCLLINPVLVTHIAVPLLTMMTLFYLPAVWIWLRHRGEAVTKPNQQQNPLALSAALWFGIILLVIMVLASGLRVWFGDTGVLLLSAISGITDVDAITLTLARQSTNQVVIATAALGIFIAAAVNSIVKMVMVFTIGDKRMRLLVGIPVISAVLLGVSSLIFLAY
ncbi:MgtC/SapB family protein [Thaumasiovibrio sp. DFM-14]|uniref:MgtC/SapB family protein n=1 Tax=Thaumasiovibrio sp. DFM-14 TaxID=3384792 RepID=UPI0039A27057